MSTRKLTVTSCNVKIDPPDKDWVLYEVAVVDEAGEPIMEEFNSFDNLPLGQLIEFTVEKRVHEQYGTSYTLKLPMGMKGALRPNVQGQIAELGQRVARLESQAGVLTGSLSTPPPSPAMASMDPVGDEDIPFKWRPAEYDDRYHGWSVFR